MSWRDLVGFIVVAVCVAFVLRLFYMQIIRGDEFLVISQQKQLRQSLRNQQIP